MITPPDDDRIDFAGEPDADYGAGVPSTPIPDGGDMPIYNLVSAEFELPDEEIVAGRYELLERIARGGMGSIYRGRDRLLNRTVAVKVLRSKFLDRPDLLRRFMDEAQISAKLQHPGVVPVYEVGTLNDGRPYIAMKLIEGMTLAKLLDERANPKENLGHFLKVFESLCQTISYAHSQGVIHRDLKPDNVMVGAFGEVLVMDWGLAKSLDEKLPKLAWGPLEVSEFTSADGSAFVMEGRATEATDCRPISLNEINIEDQDSSGLTNPGQMFGTMRYMPPEQARGDRKRMDRRSDVFALGGILCEILTGQPPYSGTSEVMREQARTANLSTAYQYLDRCGADPALVMLVKHCLAVNPDDRPSDGAALADLLSEFLEGMQARNRAMEIERFAAQTELSQAEYRAAQANREKRQSRSLAVLSAIVGVGIALLGLWFTFERPRSKGTPIPAAAITTVAQLDDSLQATDDAYQQALNQHGDLERWWTASYALERATQRQTELLDQCPNATAEQRERAAKLLQQATDEVRAARLTWAMTKQPVALFDARDGHFDAARAAQQCADTLTRNNFDVRGLTPAVAATFITEHPAAAMLTARLTEWLALTPDANERRHLHATLQAVEVPSRVRSVWLDALAKADTTTLNQLATTDPQVPLPPAALVAVARTLAVKHPATAELLLLQGVRRYPGDFALNAEIGQRLQSQPEKRGIALRHLAAAVAAEPTFIPARLALASALADAGQVDEGLDILRETQRAEPKVASVPFRMGQLLEARGAKSAARQAYRDATNADPSYAPAQVRWGQYALEANNLADAEKAFRAAIAFTPDDKPARMGLATVLLRKGAIDQAIAQLDPSMQLSNLDATTLHGFVAALRKSHREREALTLLRAHTGKPLTPELQHEWGLLLLYQDDPAALTNLKAVTELLPKSAEVRASYADALAHFGKFRPAATAYRQASDLLPPNSPQRETYTNNARQMTRFAGLETHVARIRPTDVQTLSAPSLAELGDVCQRTQRYAAAAKFYTLAAKADARHANLAAVCAAYAGFGLGSDGTTTSTAERTTFRQQARTALATTTLPLPSRLVAVLLSPLVWASVPPSERPMWAAVLTKSLAPSSQP